MHCAYFLEGSEDVVKTPTQEKLEAQKGKDITAIVPEALETRRGRHVVALAAVDLEISDATLYAWCRELGINIDSFRFAPVGPQEPAP